MVANFGLLALLSSKGRPTTKVNDDVIKLFLVYLSILVILDCICKCILGQTGPFLKSAHIYIGVGRKGVQGRKCNGGKEVQLGQGSVMVHGEKCK